METFKLPLVCLVPFLLLAIVANATSDELRMFIVYVQPHEDLVFETAADRTAWYEEFLPEDGRLRHAYHHLVYAGASGKPFAERRGNGSLDGVDVRGKIVLCELWLGPLSGLSGIPQGAVVKRAGEGMLNYPSISVTFQQSWNRSTPIIVQRTVKNVGEVPSTYYAAVDLLDDDVIVSVSPHELVFTEANQEQSFKVIVWRRQNGSKVVQGALRWVSDMHTVRSPIIISLD
ncbi:hypothetical protein EJB05_41855, partial [Eragrostis curvula]